VVKRKRRRNKKYLGSRSHGRGNIKRGRGAGTRGGVGKAGLCKHKYTALAAREKGYFGSSVRGFVNPAKKPGADVAHLYDINQRAVLGKLEKKGDKFVYEFRGKVLATGRVTVPLSIKALEWSKRVEEKLKASGGEISKLEK
jgi:large subunit ribosomal protein L15